MNLNILKVEKRDEGCFVDAEVEAGMVWPLSSEERDKRLNETSPSHHVSTASPINFHAELKYIPTASLFQPQTSPPTASLPPRAEAKSDTRMAPGALTPAY